MRKSNIKRVEFTLDIDFEQATGKHKFTVQAEKNNEIVQTSLKYNISKMLADNHSIALLQLLYRMTEIFEEAANGVETLNQWKLEDAASQV